MLTRESVSRRIDADRIIPIQEPVGVLYDNHLPAYQWQQPMQVAQNLNLVMPNHLPMNSRARCSRRCAIQTTIRMSRGTAKRRPAPTARLRPDHSCHCRSYSSKPALILPNIDQN